MEDLILKVKFLRLPKIGQSAANHFSVRVRFAVSNCAFRQGWYQGNEFSTPTKTSPCMVTGFGMLGLYLFVDFVVKNTAAIFRVYWNPHFSRTTHISKSTYIRESHFDNNDRDDVFIVHTFSESGFNDPIAYLSYFRERAYWTLVRRFRVLVLI